MFPSPADGKLGQDLAELYQSDPLSLMSQADDTSDDELSTVSGSSASKNRYLFPAIDSVESLRPEQIRWFYREEGHKRWRPFLGYDSLRLECKDREILKSQNEKTKEEKHESENITVRGGLYEVDVLNRKCYPIYWSRQASEQISVCRGTWFLDNTWQPIEELNAEKIEQEHLAKFQGQKIDQEEPEPTKGPSPVINNLKFKEFHVDWNTINRVYLFSEATSSKLYRAVGNKLGLSKSGTRLHRGYCYEGTMDDKPPDITHLVFVIHGIGQKMDTGSIVKSCKDLRETCSKIKEKLFEDLDENNKRVEFLPVEWRSSLKLDGDTVESITPHKVKGLRTILNSSAMDILYYTSPLYRAEITQGLQTQLNRLYTTFCERHPYFEASGGKVSVVAHSLGCVITYDIITGWNPIQLYDQYVANVMEMRSHNADECADLIMQLEKARARVNELESELLALTAKQQVKSSTLKFKLENFFCLGSPLAVFLALRGVRPKGNGTQDHILHRNLCSRVFNLYHPSDPIAYRVEPLILKHYAGILPLRVHKHDAMRKPPYENLKPKAYSTPPTGRMDKDPIAEVEGVKKQKKTQSSLSGAIGSVLKGWGRKSPKGQPIVAEMRKMDSPPGGDSEDGASCNISSPNEKTLDQTELEYRLDYMLKEGAMENAYIATLTSHTSYWANMDVALFILTQLFPLYGPK